MFTGIVAAVGAIESIVSLADPALIPTVAPTAAPIAALTTVPTAAPTAAPKTAAPVAPLAADPDASGVRLIIQAAELGLDDVMIGDSIAIQGACMTVVAIGGRAGGSATPAAASLPAGRFAVEVSLESLSKTVGLAAPGPVNLEKALRLADRLGGHLVSGHVDGLGRVAEFVEIAESWRLGIDVPADLARYFAYKGSVTINGVSLTVNRVIDDVIDTRIEMNLIPHTLAVTTLAGLQVGDCVNLEVDQIARYCERLLTSGVRSVPGVADR